jgi:hypothetical protein
LWGLLIKSFSWKYVPADGEIVSTEIFIVPLIDMCGSSYQMRVCRDYNVHLNSLGLKFCFIISRFWKGIDQLEIRRISSIKVKAQC